MSGGIEEAERNWEYGNVRRNYAGQSDWPAAEAYPNRNGAAMDDATSRNQVNELPTVRARDLLGLWENDPRTVQEIMDEMRGSR